MSVKVGLCLVALRARPPFTAAARGEGQMQDMQGFPAPSHCSCISFLFTDFVVWPQASHSRCSELTPRAVWCAREGNRIRHPDDHINQQVVQGFRMWVLKRFLKRRSLFPARELLSQKTELPASDSPTAQAGCRLGVGGNVSRTAFRIPVLF